LGQSIEGETLPDAVGVVLAYYESARSEIIARIAHRDSVVVLFLGAATAVFGVGVGRRAQASVLFAIPVLGLGAAHILVLHNNAVGALGEFCAVECTAQMDGLAGQRLVHWDISSSLAGEAFSNFQTRLLASGFLLGLPQVAAVALADVEVKSISGRLSGSGVGLVSLLWTTRLFQQSHRSRVRHWENTQRFLVARFDS
jgi:hypothetical protein